MRKIRGGIFENPRIECECGEEIDLVDGLDNPCPKCDRNYNLFGQLVLRSYDPRVEEPYEDDR